MKKLLETHLFFTILTGEAFMSNTTKHSFCTSINLLLNLIDESEILKKMQVYRLKCMVKTNYEMSFF